MVVKLTVSGERGSQRGRRSALRGVMDNKSASKEVADLLKEVEQLRLALAKEKEEKHSLALKLRGVMRGDETTLANNAAESVPPRTSLPKAGTRCR